MVAPSPCSGAKFSGIIRHIGYLSVLLQPEMFKSK